MSRIAIDAMGGDYAPRAIVEGAVWAAQEYGVGLELVGRQEDIQAELDRIKAAGCVYSIIEAKLWKIFKSHTIFVLV